MKTKQVIVMRKDLNMRRGKQISQGCHASMKVFFDIMKKEVALKYISVLTGIKEVTTYSFKATDEMIEWIDGKFTKICVSVDSEQELLDIYKQAQEANLPCSLIQDSGLTEFKFTLCKNCGDAIHSLGHTESCGYPLCECGEKAVTGERLPAPTYTCCAIGPANAEDIDKITGGLKLL